jgi:signal peptidase II
MFAVTARLRWSAVRIHPFLALFACVAALVGCDHATKLAAESSLRDRAPVTVVHGVLDLRYAENRDIAFDTFSRFAIHPSAAALSLCAGVGIVAILVLWTRRANASAREHAAFVFILAGALGNVIDRVVRGHVVDFIHPRFWPTFNVADVLVAGGVGLLLLTHGDAKRIRPSSASS